MMNGCLPESHQSEQSLCVLLSLDDFVSATMNRCPWTAEISTAIWNCDIFILGLSLRTRVALSLTERNEKYIKMLPYLVPKIYIAPIHANPSCRPSLGDFFRPAPHEHYKGRRIQTGIFKKWSFADTYFPAFVLWTPVLDPSVICIFPSYTQNQRTHLHLKRALFDCVRPTLTRVISFGQPGCVQYGPSCLSKPCACRKFIAVTSFSETVKRCLRLSGILSGFFNVFKFVYKFGKKYINFLVVI